MIIGVIFACMHECERFLDGASVVFSQQARHQVLTVGCVLLPAIELPPSLPGSVSGVGCVLFCLPRRVVALG